MKKIKEAFFIPKALGTQFYAESHDILISGSLVNWDTVKLKSVEQYGTEINLEYYESKFEEREAAKNRRDKLRKGVLKPS